MNKYRRTVIAELLNQLVEIYDNLEAVKDEEEEALENYPENLRYSERGEAMQEAFDNLEEAHGAISEAIDLLQNIE
ncbi:MAG: hypothetical protein IKC61_03400 [Clostridia bacterium]|nr:hypothetical protein [Clostridia bacterium]